MSKEYRQTLLPGRTNKLTNTHTHSDTHKGKIKCKKKKKKKGAGIFKRGEKQMSYRGDPPVLPHRTSWETLVCAFNASWRWNKGRQRGGELPHIKKRQEEGRDDLCLTQTHTHTQRNVLPQLSDSTWSLKANFDSLSRIYTLFIESKCTKSKHNDVKGSVEKSKKRRGFFFLLLFFYFFIVVTG